MRYIYIYISFYLFIIKVETACCHRHTSKLASNNWTRPRPHVRNWRPWARARAGRRLRWPCRGCSWSTCSRTAAAAIPTPPSAARLPPSNRRLIRRRRRSAWPKRALLLHHHYEYVLDVESFCGNWKWRSTPLLILVSKETAKNFL